MSEKVRLLGSTFNYSWYFEKRRNRFFKQRKKRAKEFIDGLEIASLVAVRMTGGDAGLRLNLNDRRPMDRNKQCNICQNFVSKIHEQSIMYFKAQKVKRPGEFSCTNGFTLDWTHEKLNYAAELGPFEWTSGPLLLCDNCLKAMHWYEEHIHRKHIQLAIEKLEFKKLPAVFGLYSSLEKSLRLAEFFGRQVAVLLRDPHTDPKSLEEVKRCISNSCNVINVIGKQIGALGTRNKREFALQKHISQYCSHVVTDLSCLFAISQEELACSTVMILPKVENSTIKNDERSIFDDILGGLYCMFCLSERSTRTQVAMQQGPKVANNNDTLRVQFDKYK